MEEEDVVEESNQRMEGLSKKKKRKTTNENDVKAKSARIKNKKQNYVRVQEEGPNDKHEKSGLNDVEIALKSITVKVRNKLLFNNSTMEGGWFDQVG